MQKFITFYDSYPMSFVLLNDDGTARCGIQKRPTAKEFIVALSDAIQEEIGAPDIKLEISNVSEKHYTASVKAMYTDHEGFKAEEDYTLESMGIY